MKKKQRSKEIIPQRKNKTMAKFELTPVKTWTEKDEGFKAGTLRIYIYNIHLGWAEPVRGLMELYHFKSLWYYPLFESVPTNKMPLADILMHVELCLKEFVNKVIK
jgi:hypothetical protein